MYEYQYIYTVDYCNISQQFSHYSTGQYTVLYSYIYEANILNIYVRKIHFICRFITLNSKCCVNDGKPFILYNSKC